LANKSANQRGKYSYRQSKARGSAAVPELEAINNKMLSYRKETALLGAL